MLQFVGHEIAHVELKHAIKCLQDPDLKNSELGTLPEFLLFILPLGYPDAQDFEADRWAFDRMTSPRLDRSRHEALSVPAASSRGTPSATSSKRPNPAQAGPRHRR